MSLDRFRTLLTLVPLATSTSYIVTVGPRWAATTFASTPNVRRVWPSACITSVSCVPSAVDGGAVRSRSSGGSWYGPCEVVIVRGFAAFAGLAGASSVRGSVASASGSTTIGSAVGSSPRPSASLTFERLFGLGSFSGLASGTSTWAVCGSSTGTRRWCFSLPRSAETGRPGEDQEPEEREPGADDPGADLGDHPGERVGGERADEAPGLGEPVELLRGVVPGERARVAAREREDPEHPDRQDREPDEHPDPVLGRDVTQQHDAPVDPHDREEHRGDPERPVQEPREALAHRPGGVEPHAEHREQREHHQADARRVARVRREDLPRGHALGLLGRGLLGRGAPLGGGLALGRGAG